jgi:phosphoglycolate phosphatase
VADSLHALANLSVPLAVCTSKRAESAERILRMFGLIDLFRFVDGGDIRISKTEQIRQLRKSGVVTSNAIMIGDRSVDLIAAHQNGLRSGGVLWGYGSLAELEAERPAHLFRRPAEWDMLVAGWRA